MHPVLSKSMESCPISLLLLRGKMPLERQLALTYIKFLETKLFIVIGSYSTADCARVCTPKVLRHLLLGDGIDGTGYSFEEKRPRLTSMNFR